MLLLGGLFGCIVFAEGPVDAVESVCEADAEAPPDEGGTVAFMGEREADENDHQDENQHLETARHGRPQDLPEMPVGDVRNHQQGGDDDHGG